MSPFWRPKFGGCPFFIFFLENLWTPGLDYTRASVLVYITKGKRVWETVVEMAVDLPARMPLVGLVRKACDIVFKGIAHEFLCRKLEFFSSLLLDFVEFPAFSGST
jgi:hypothetical protein